MLSVAVIGSLWGAMQGERNKLSAKEHEKKTNCIVSILSKKKLYCEYGLLYKYFSLSGKDTHIASLALFVIPFEIRSSTFIFVAHMLYIY
jgi:hypothetical protein